MRLRSVTAARVYKVTQIADTRRRAGTKRKKSVVIWGERGWRGTETRPRDGLQMCRPRYRAQGITVEFPSSIASSCSRPLLLGAMLISLEEGGPSREQGLIRGGHRGPIF